MSDDVMGVSQSDASKWDHLLSEQTELFRKTLGRNEVLAAKVDELERELAVWKIAQKSADDERLGLQKRVSELERNIGSLKDDYPLILCLIDGDGNIFLPELITSGQEGGRRAAALLNQGLTEHIAAVEPSSGRAQVWLTIYCNQKGLTETLVNTKACTAEQFDDFVMGFNQASPLFSIVDVGIGKEAADAKIKEYLRVFTRFPQTLCVFFGGAHDNGYKSTLNQLQNEGLLHKLILLRGYKDLAYELKSLNLPYLEVEGVFMTKKLQTPSYKKPAPLHNAQKRHESHTSTRTQTPVSETSGAHPMSKAPQTSTSAPSPPNYRQLTPGVPLFKQKPPPCNFFYLTSCSYGDKCIYAHDYRLSTKQVNDLRKAVSKFPCPNVNKGNACKNGGNCPMAHFCPQGPSCQFKAANKCRFIDPSTHHPYWTNTAVAPPEYSSPSMRSASPVLSLYSMGVYEPTYMLGDDERGLPIAEDDILWPR